MKCPQKNSFSMCAMGFSLAASLLSVPVTAHAGVFFREDFEATAWLDQWSWHIFPNPETGRVTNVKRQGAASFRSYLTYDDAMNIDPHSEIKKDGLGRIGDTRWWSFSFYVPSSYVSDSSLTILQQVKSKEDDGEDPHSPQFQVKLTGESVILTNRYEKLDGTTVYRELYRTPIRRGQWTDVVFQAKFATVRSTFTGYINAWINGSKVVNNVTGANTFMDADPLYFKVGVYKRNWPNTTAKSIYFDCVRLGDTNTTLNDMRP